MENSPYNRFRFAHLAPRHWPAWLLLGFFNLLARLPVAIALSLGKGLGYLLYWLAGPRRRIADINIALCFPGLSPAEQRQMARQAVIGVGINMAETAIGLWGKPEKSMARCTLSGLEHIEALQTQGKGVLLMGGHYMTMDMCARRLAQGVQFDMLYRDQPNPLFFHRVLAIRESFAGKTIERRDTRQMIRRLREGHVVWYAPDQDYGSKHSVFAPFFGVSAATITATMRIAEMGRAVVVPLYHYRDEHNHYHVEIQPPLENFPSGDDVADAARINQVIERNVARYPEQYFWVHRRFKTRPEGEAPLYPSKKRRRRAPAAG